MTWVGGVTELSWLHYIHQEAISCKHTHSGPKIDGRAWPFHQIDPRSIFTLSEMRKINGKKLSVVVRAFQMEIEKLKRR